MIPSLAVSSLLKDVVNSGPVPAFFKVSSEIQTCPHAGNLVSRPTSLSNEPWTTGYFHQTSHLLQSHFFPWLSSKLRLYEGWRKY